MKNLMERKDCITDRAIFLDGKGAWPKDIVIKQNKEILRYRLIRTRAGKFQLIK